MTLRSQGPWLVSLGLHALVLTVGAVLLLSSPRPTPGVLRMRLSAPAGPAATAAPAHSPWIPPSNAPPTVAEPALPAWRGTGPAAAALPSAPPPVSLDELLRGTSVATEPDADTVRTANASAGWSGPLGQGYAPPPLPPPGLAPPQGAEWTLLLSIPAGGGPARSFEGLDSGNPELDHWLEEYLRTVSFPSSPDGQDYQVRWNLRLLSGRPE